MTKRILRTIMITFLAVALAIAAALLVSCSSDISSSSSSTTSGSAVSTSSSSSSTYTAATASRDITSDNYDDIADEDFTATSIDVDLSSLTIGSVTATTSKQTVVEGITVKIETKMVKINAASYSGNIVFNISGTESGYGIQIKGNGTDSVKVVLNSASITSVSTPCIKFTDVPKAYVVLSGTSTLTDGRTFGVGYSEANGTDYYDDEAAEADIEDGAEETASWAEGDDSKGTLFSKGSIIISGSGSLSITEGYKHGIYAKDYIKINDGEITITSTGRNGIQSINGFIMNDGEVTITGTGENTNNESRGIIVEGEESEDTPAEGFIVINGGTINISTVSKAISAKWDIDDDAETSSTADDPYPYVKINGGTITVETTGTPKDESSSTYSVMDANGVYALETTKLSPEGIEGKQAVYITGGTIYCETTDDCINASTEKSAVVEISGGYIFAHSSNNDCIDSNGKLTISGGVVVAYTTTTPECAFDCDNYTFAITGGYVVGIGTNNYSTPTSSACDQNVMIVGSSYFSKGNYAIKDSSGNVVFAFTVPATSDVMILSSPDIETGTSYTVYKNCTFSGGTAYNGLYYKMPTVSGGTSVGTITFSSSTVYTFGTSTSSNNGPQEGQHQNFGPGN